MIALRLCWISILLVLMVEIAAAENTVEISTNYYNISGATIEELRKSIRENRPWKETRDADAYTTWRVHWRYTTRRHEGTCRLNTFTTRTSITITVPRWIPPTNAPPKLVEQWKRTIVMLHRHEDGHKRIGLAAAEAIQKKMSDLPEQASCDALDKEISKQANDIVADFKKREARYDEITEHGRKQ